MSKIYATSGNNSKTFTQEDNVAVIKVDKPFGKRRCVSAAYLSSEFTGMTDILTTTGFGMKRVNRTYLKIGSDLNLYKRVVALQMAYCTYLFEDSVVKI